MMASLGKAVHISRLQNRASGRILTVALDHAPSYGVLAGLERIAGTIARVAEGGPDAMLLMKGTAERCFAPYVGEIALIMKCSTISPFHPDHDVLVSSVAQALRLGADAVAMAVTIGGAQQSEILDSLSRLVQEAESVGMPVIAHAYPCGECVPADERYTLAQVRYAARLAMEVGVDIVKTFYTGSAETFAEVVEAAAPALVVAAGGPKTPTAADTLKMAYDVVQAGAAGITFGRNVWQQPEVPAMVRALRSVVHDGESAEAAGQLLATQ